MNSFRPTQLILIAAVNEGHRRRTKYGNLQRVAASLTQFGQLQPIIVDQLASGQYCLVAGGRRLRAARQLGWKQIEAVLRESMPDPDMRAIEVEENEQRLAYNDQERAKSFAANKQIVEKAAEFRSRKPTKDHNSAKGKRGRPANTTSQRTVAEEMGISHQQLSRAEMRRLAVSEDDRDRDQALTLATDRPPAPDPSRCGNPESGDRSAIAYMPIISRNIPVELTMLRSGGDKGTPKQRNKVLARTEAYRRQNERVAALILRDAPRWGGEEAALVRWARLVFRQAELRPAA